MSPATHPDSTVPAAAARQLLLAGAGLLDRPDRAATPKAVAGQIERMGFVQVDTINIVERAHHHILQTRLASYRPATLTRLLERDRRFFEHWTHDASIIPTRWYGQWQYRFNRYRAKDLANQWWMDRIGPNPEAVIAHVRERLAEDGPLMSRDFKHERPASERPEGGKWWSWKPQKTALEFLWRSGEVAVAGREHFHKRYDLPNRVFPKHVDKPAPDEADHLEWACGEALNRLGAATPSELAGFFRAIPLADARRWCAAATADGRAIPVTIESADGSKPKAGVALPDWKRRAARTPDPPKGIRMLSPFDPAIRDRARTLRLFNFHYRFEAFTPAPKRQYGYYVFPLLEGDRLVGRLDSKLHRDRGEYEIKGIWWEDGVKPTRARCRALDTAIQTFATWLGADHVVGDAAEDARCTRNGV